MPLGERFSYVAECTPMLLMQNNDFEKLEELAETKDGIPHNKPTEQRSIYLARLTYAVKAAIRLGHYKSALKLAFLAGEESSYITAQGIVIDGGSTLPETLTVGV